MIMLLIIGTRDSKGAVLRTSTVAVDPLVLLLICKQFRQEVYNPVWDATHFDIEVPFFPRAIYPVEPGERDLGPAKKCGVLQKMRNVTILVPDMLLDRDFRRLQKLFSALIKNADLRDVPVELGMRDRGYWCIYTPVLRTKRICTTLVHELKVTGVEARMIGGEKGK